MFSKTELMQLYEIFNGLANGAEHISLAQLIAVTKLSIKDAGKEKGLKVENSSKCS